jgi:hypothetical protein
MWLLLAGCGGLKDGTKLRDLDEDQAKDLCEEYSDEQTAKCDYKGQTIPITVGGTECDVGSAKDDPKMADCDATVGDYRDCMDALYDDPCQLITGLPPECSWFEDCMPAK